MANVLLTAFALVPPAHHPGNAVNTVRLKTAFEPEPPSHKQARIKLMEHICKKQLYTLKTERINLFNKLLGFPSDAD